jgi:hypothetical protein
MKTRYKHIHFAPTCFNGVFSCVANKGDMELGVVGPGAWKRITFRPAELTEFSAGCLEDIIHFIGQLEGKHTNSMIAEPEMTDEEIAEVARRIRWRSINESIAMASRQKAGLGTCKGKP